MRSACNLKGVVTVPGETKNYSSKRQLELPDMIIPILHSIRAEQSQQKLKLQNEWADEGWVFTRYNGKLISQDLPDRWLSEMKKVPGMAAQRFSHFASHSDNKYAS